MAQNRIQQAKLMLKQIHDLVTPGEFCQLVKEVAPEFNLFHSDYTTTETRPEVPETLLSQKSQVLQPSCEVERSTGLELEDKNHLRWSSPASMSIAAPSPPAEVKPRGSESAKTMRRCVRSASYPISNCTSRLMRNSSEFRDLVTAMSLKQLNKCNSKSKALSNLVVGSTGGSSDFHHPFSHTHSFLNTHSFADPSVERELIPAV